tara:strand:+ start:393 stop:1265 length:873 start_codon:yes stop_codon:yes gene_type:complete
MNISEKIITYKNKNLDVINPEKTNDGTEIRFSYIFPFIKQALLNLELNDFKFAISMNDFSEETNDHNLPFLSFCKTSESNHILIPNVDFFTGLIYKCIKESSFDIFYRTKSDSSIFAGSDTGGLNRIKYCNAILNDNNNFGVINFVQNKTEDISIKYPNFEQFSGRLTIAEQLKHKIVVNIDGNTLCWSRLYWQMNSNSIPVYINKTNRYKQYFDKFDDSDCYFEASEDYLDIYDYILDPKNIKHVNRINNNGKNYIKKYFSEYINNPNEFLLKTVTRAVQEAYRLYKLL